MDHLQVGDWNSMLTKWCTEISWDGVHPLAHIWIVPATFACNLRTKLSWSWMYYFRSFSKKKHLRKTTLSQATWGHLSSLYMCLQWSCRFLCRLMVSTWTDSSSWLQRCTYQVSVWTNQGARLRTWRIGADSLSPGVRNSRHSCGANG